jgi:hypothetical protein
MCKSLIISARNSLGQEESKASLNLLTLFFFASYDSRFTQTLFSDSFMEINPENPLTLIRVFYNYFLTDNPDLHTVIGKKAQALRLREHGEL